MLSILLIVIIIARGEWAHKYSVATADYKYSAHMKMTMYTQGKCTPTFQTIALAKWTEGLVEEIGVLNGFESGNKVFFRGNISVM